ncbi:MAG: CoA ester lyase, partial [Phototrophicales bacterium]
MTHDDLAAILPAKPDAILLPKVESASDIHLIDRMMAETDAALLALVETARGIVHLREIAACAETIPRLQALIFGAEDFAGDIGALRTAGGHEIAYGRGAVVVHAKAFGLQAIDMVFLPLDDEAGLRAEARNGRELGYTGKMAIHPRQIAPIQEAFSPTADEIAAAKRLIEAFD